MKVICDADFQCSIYANDKRKCTCKKGEKSSFELVEGNYKIAIVKSFGNVQIKEITITVDETNNSKEVTLTIYQKDGEICIYSSELGLGYISDVADAGANNNTSTSRTSRTIYAYNEMLLAEIKNISSNTQSIKSWVQFWSILTIIGWIIAIIATLIVSCSE